MNDFDKLDPLTKESEEYQMLREVAKKWPEQVGGSKEQKIGKATMIVIREHLSLKRLNLAELDAKIPKKGNMNNLFLLDKGVPNKPDSLDNVNMVINITNNAVADKS